jgi:hypothetical protein
VQARRQEEHVRQSTPPSAASIEEQSTVSSLLDAILGNFNSGSANLPPSGGYVPPNQAPELAADPYGKPIGGPAPGVPLPRPRLVEAGPPAVSPPAAALPDIQPDESGGTGGPGGGFGAALGLDPDRTKTLTTRPTRSLGSFLAVLASSGMTSFRSPSKPAMADFSPAYISVLASWT